MSKIYEALQRAEQERLDNLGKSPAATIEALAAEPETLTSAPDLPAPSPGKFDPATLPPLADSNVRSSLASTPQARSLPQQPSAQLPEPPSDTAPLDLSAVPTAPWAPLLNKLPALAERGGAVEQFRSLRTRLFAFRDLNKLKSIMISSGLPREGKSFIAANLAISFARHKASRVLLIDGDMRRSSLHTLLGAAQKPGLSDYLAGDCDIVSVMQRAQLNADGSPLFAGLGSVTFIGGGAEGDKAADLSGSKRFRQLIERASPYFDWIVVDSSPVNLVTDGVNLAAACDAVLMVARGGVTKFEAAQRALGELKASKILGVVLNAVETSPSTDGYYGYGGYDGYDSISNPAPAAGPPSS
jgi:protein-tyrosine kinase